MSVEMIQERLASYGCVSALEEDQALREISQEIILAGLGRTDFFNRAGFQGGTCLRIFHSLNRFSEDLDFALRQPHAAFELVPYLAEVRQELTAYGYKLEIDDRSSADQAVKKAFLKDDSLGTLLHLKYRPRSGPLRKLRVKLEVDTHPPAGASYQMPVLDYPFHGKSLSAVAGLPMWNVYFRLYAGSVQSPPVGEFPPALVRHIDGPLWVIGDGLPAPRSRLVRDHLESLAGWIHRQYLPGYAPEPHCAECAAAHA